MTGDHLSVHLSPGSLLLIIGSLEGSYWGLGAYQGSLNFLLLYSEIQSGLMMSRIGSSETYLDNH